VAEKKAPHLTSLEQICEKHTQAVLWLVQNKGNNKSVFWNASFDGAV
jgi:hypothetical protein